MKNLSKINYFVFLVLAFLFNMPAFSAGSDDYEQLYLQAHQLKESGCYKEAATEYKRYLFMTDYSENSGKYNQEAYLALSSIYEKENAYEIAADYYKKAMNLAKENTELSTSDLARLKGSYIDFLSRKAQFEKRNLEMDADFMYYFCFADNDEPESRELTYKIQYAYLKNLALSNQWEVLQNEFTDEKIYEKTLFTPEDVALCLENINKLLSFKPKKTMTALHLSIIPGLGQLYAGDYGDALNAFLLNGGLIALSVYSCSTLNLWDFSLLELSPTIRFYKGNLANAQKAVINWNAKKYDEYKQPVIYCISNANDKISFKK